MIGGLADWFAVEALFRHPLGVPIPHTALLPRNQARAARTSGASSRRISSTPATLAGRLRRDRASDGIIVDWLARPDNARPASPASSPACSAACCSTIRRRARSPGRGRGCGRRPARPAPTPRSPTASPGWSRRACAAPWSPRCSRWSAAPSTTTARSRSTWCRTAAAGGSPRPSTAGSPSLVVDGVLSLLDELRVDGSDAPARLRGWPSTAWSTRSPPRARWPAPSARAGATWSSPAPSTRRCAAAGRRPARPAARAASPRIPRPWRRRSPSLIRDLAARTARRRRRPRRARRPPRRDRRPPDRRPAPGDQRPTSPTSSPAGSRRSSTPASRPRSARTCSTSASTAPCSAR